jgi:hypothetical protein
MGLNAAPRTFARALGQAQSTEAENPSLRGHKCGIQAQRRGWDQSIWDMSVKSPPVEGALHALPPVRVKCYGDGTASVLPTSMAPE